MVEFFVFRESFGTLALLGIVTVGDLLCLVELVVWRLDLLQYSVLGLLVIGFPKRVAAMSVGRGSGLLCGLSWILVVQERPIA